MAHVEDLLRGEFEAAASTVASSRPGVDLEVFSKIPSDLDVA